MNQLENRFESLVWKFLDQDISDEEFAEFQQLLQESGSNRERYQFLVEVHQTIRQKSEQDTLSEDLSLAKSVTASSAARRVEKKQSSSRSLLMVSIASVAASIVLLFALSSFQQESSLDVEYVSLRNADIRGKSIGEGDKASTRMIHLASGAVAMRFPTQTEVVIEGPAWYQVQDNGSIVLASGTITVDHQGEPGQFKVVTPLGDLVDMGTKFGVSVGDGMNDSMVMTEVYEGEVIFNNAQNSSHSIQEGQGVAILGNHRSQDILREINGEQVKVSGSFRLSDDSEKLRSLTNLALGKPATANSIYSNSRNGETFGADALTDGRCFDTGSPWNWSFWLAANGVSGTATVDLLETYSISRVELQNTRNRHHDDRGMKDFVIEVSQNGSDFVEVARGQLKRVKSQDPSAFEFERFEFPSTDARFVRIRGLSHYLWPGKSHTGCGGLNEIRVFE